MSNLKRNSHTRDQAGRLIFVGGAPRSGTTLVQNILDTHPDVCAVPEFHFLRKFIQLKKDMTQASQRGIIEAICLPDEIRSNFRKLICNFLLPVGDREGKHFVSEKTPENILIFEELIQLLPEAHYIFVIRDPRAVVASLKKVKMRARKQNVAPPRISASLLASIEHTRKCMKAGIEAHNRFPDKILGVVYENLLENPDKETQRICNFLQISWTPKMLTPGEMEHKIEKPITEVQHNVWYDRSMFRRNIDASAKEAWRNILRSREIALVNQQLASLSADLERFGYALDGGSSFLQKAMIVPAYCYFYFQELRFLYRRFKRRIGRDI